MSDSDSPVMVSTGMVGAGDGCGLWREVWDSPAGTRGDVVITHGLGEHLGRYAHVREALCLLGLRVHLYDLRGHGRSEGRRGDAARYGLFVDDLAGIVGRVEGQRRPLFLMGHSLGGQITLQYALRGGLPACVRGLIVSAPWLRLVSQPSRAQEAMAQVLAFCWPGLRRSTGITGAMLSRDGEHLASLAAPELVHDRISLRLYFEIVAAGRELLRRAGEVKLPMLLVHGGHDGVTSLAASKEFFRRLSSVDREMKVYPEALHEPHNDAGREVVIGDFCGWIEARLGGAE